MNNSQEEIKKASSRRQNMQLRKIPQCPIFEPTLKEFTEMSFKDYITECEKVIAPTCGVFKVSLLDPLTS